MRPQSLYPLKLQPALHVKVWGGRRLASHLNKKLPTRDPYGEAWELHDSALIVNGALRGMSLGELTRRDGGELIGAGPGQTESFPLLAKFIDANAWLSIQVHPDDAQARLLEGEPRGKTEAWVVLHAEPGARLVTGLRRGTTPAQLAAAIRRQQLDPLLAYAVVERGDVLYIPANTVHALGPGLLIYEIQQSSDTTYRLHDWGRLGLDGEPRELHIEKGLRVANLGSPPEVARPEGDLLVDGRYFRTWRHRLLDEPLAIDCNGRFQSLTCIDGSMRVDARGHESIALAKGETCLMPACLDRFTLVGSGIVLRSCQS